MLLSSGGACSRCWQAEMTGLLITAGGPGARVGCSLRAGWHICCCWQPSHDLPSRTLSSLCLCWQQDQSHTCLPPLCGLSLRFFSYSCFTRLSFLTVSLQRQGRCDTFATEFDLEAEEYVPLPKGDVHKKKEIVQDVTLHDLDVANARPQVHHCTEAAIQSSETAPNLRCRGITA